MATANPLPVLETVKKSFGDAFLNPKAQWQVLKWIAAAMVGINLLVVIFGFATRGLNDTTATLPSRPVLFVTLLLQLAVISAFAYNWYRQELLGENRGASIMLKAGPGEITMGLTILKVFAFTGLPLMVGAYLFRFLGLFGVLLDIALFVACAYAGLRFTLTSPLAAVGDATPLKTSWDIMEPHLVRALGGLALLLLGFYIPVLIALLIFKIVFGYILPASIMALVLAVVQGVIITAFMLLVSCFVANLYRFIKA